jgi:hypothetical protein
MPSTAQNAQQYMEEFGAPLVYFKTLDPSGVARLDMSRSYCHQVTLNANAVIGQPSAPPPLMTRVILQLVQDTTGGWSVTWASCWRNPPAWTSGNGVANTTALGEFLFDGQSYQFVGGSSDFAISAASIVALVGGMALQGSTPAVVPEPAPAAGAVTVAGLAPGVHSNTIVTRVPTIGAVTLAGVASTVSQIDQTLVPGSGGVTVTGLEPTRTP